VLAASLHFPVLTRKRSINQWLGRRLDENASAAHPDLHTTSKNLNPLHPIDIATAFQGRDVPHIVSKTETETDPSDSVSSDSAKEEDADDDS